MLSPAQWRKFILRAVKALTLAFGGLCSSHFGRCLLVFATCTALSNRRVWSQPSIQNTSSSILEHGTPVTIYGSDFGIKDPAAPLIWDDFEDGIDPRWAVVSGMQLNADNSRHTRTARNAVGDFSRYRPLTFSKNDVGFTKFYACYWFKLGPNFVWYKGPVASTPLSNLKCFRIWNHADPQDNYCNVYVNFMTWSDSIARLVVEEGVGGGNCALDPQAEITINRWHHQEFQWSENSAPNMADGTVRYWVNGQVRFSSDSLVSSTSAHPQRGKHISNVGGFEHYWGYPDTSIHLYSDDVYLDTTWARVMIGNARTWAQCTHREIQMPTEWSQTSITVRVNQGSYAVGAQAYLFVIDADGNVNNGGQGHSIHFGELEDNTPPMVTEQSPAPNEQNVPVNSSIVLHVQDSGDGVNIYSIQMQVNGEAVTPQITGDPPDYTLTYVPSSSFDYGALITVTVRAQDLHNPPNVMSPVTYSFSAEPADAVPPVVTRQSPAPGQQGVSVNSSVVLHVQDYGDGVDVGSIRMEVNGLTVTPQITGSVSDYTVTYVPPAPFGYDSVVTVRVNARDLHDPPNVMSEVTYSFRTHPEGLVAEVWGDSEGSNHPGTIEDTYINLNSENYSSDPISLNAYTWPANSIANAILMKFDLSAIPTNATVISAKLQLYMFDASSHLTYNVSAHKILNVDPVIGAATGYTCDGTNPWTPYEGLYNDIPLGQADIAPAEWTTAVDTAPGFKEWTITDMVSEWTVNPETNRGLMLNSDPSAPSDARRYFRPSEFTDPVHRPRVEITYYIDTDPIPGPPGKPVHVD